MTTQLAIRESVTEAPVKKGNRWKVIVARPGIGSSGTYSEDLFRRDASKLIPAGAQSFINHGERDPEKMIGVFPDGGYFDEEENAVVAELQVFEHWKAWVEEMAPHVGMSLYAKGEADEEGNVTAILEDAYNGADLVSRPGLKGSQIASKLYEAAVNAVLDEKPGVTAAQEERKLEMEKDVQDAFDALHALIAPLVTAKQTAQEQAAQVEADEKVVEGRLDAYDAAVEAIEAAELPADAAKSLRAEARKGVDVAPLIEFAKSVKDGEAARLAESAEQGRDFGARKVESATDLGKVFG